MAIKNLYLPLILFPLLSYIANTFIFGHALQSGMASEMEAAVVPYRLSYTGFTPLDSLLAKLVAVFHEAMKPSSLPFMNYFLGANAPIIPILFHIETYRQRTSIFLSFPTIFALLYQLFTFGVVMPIYSLLFIITGAASRSPEGPRTQITQAHAEAILFSVLVGGVIPTISMLVLEDPYVTAIWQGFPIWSCVAREAHLLFRPPSRHSSSGYRTIQFALIACFTVSSSIHIATVYPKLPDLVALRVYLFPSLSPMDASAGLEATVRNLMQWDMVMGMGSTILLTLWFSHSLQQFMTIVAWHIVAVPVFGAGAATAAILLWRESFLQGTPIKDKDKSL